jgi:hypothetical protein
MTGLAVSTKALAEYGPKNRVRFVTAAALLHGNDAEISVTGLHERAQDTRVPVLAITGRSGFIGRNDERAGDSHEHAVL